MRIEEAQDAQGSALSRYLQRLFNSEYSDARESPLSVARKWLPWSVGLIFALTIGWTALIAWIDVLSGNHEGILETAVAVGSKTAPAAPLIVIYSIMVTSVTDTLGGMVMVTARYLGPTSSSSLSLRSTGRRAETKVEHEERRNVDRMEYPPPRSGEERTSLSTSRRPHRRKPTVSTRESGGMASTLRQNLNESRALLRDGGITEWRR